MVKAIWEEYKNIISTTVGIIASIIIIVAAIPLFSTILNNTITRVSTIENDYWTTTSDAASDITYTSAEYTVLNNQLSQLSTKVSGVETNLGSVTNSISNINNSLSNIDTIINTINTRLTEATTSTKISLGFNTSQLNGYGGVCYIENGICYVVGYIASPNSGTQLSYVGNLPAPADKTYIPLTTNSQAACGYADLYAGETTIKFNCFNNSSNNIAYIFNFSYKIAN